MNELAPVINFLPDPAFMIDNQGRVIAWNHAMEELTGLQAQAILGKGDYEYALPFYGEKRPLLIDLVFVPMEELQKKYVTVKREGETLIGENYVPHLKGGRYLLGTAAALRDAQGNITGAIETLRDLTQRKQVEERLSLLEAALESAANAILITNRQGHIIWVNSAFSQLTGYNLEDALGQNPRVLKSGQHDAAFYKNLWQTILAGQVWHGEIINRRQDGSHYTEEMTITPVRDQDQNINHFIAVKQDVTARKRLEQQVNAILERRGRQVQTSTEISQEIAAAPALDELFKRVVTLIKERFGYYHAQILQYESALDSVVLVAGYGEAGSRMIARGHRLAMGRGVVGTAAATGQSILATDVRQDRDWRPNPDLPDTQGELAVPIKLRERVMGILDVQSDQAGALTEEDQLLLEGLCGQVAIAIEDTRLRLEMEERLKELNTMYRVTSHEGWEAFRQTTQLPGGYTFDRVSLKAAPNLWTPEIQQAVEKNQLVMPRPSLDSSPGPAVAPLTVRGGEIIGALGVYDDPKQPLSPDDLTLIESVSEQVSLAMENARLLEQSRTTLAETETLYRISAALNAAKAYEDVLEALRKHTGFGYADQNISLNVFDCPWTQEQQPQRIEVVAFWTPEEGTLQSSTTMPVAASPAQLLRADAPTLIPDIANDPRLDDRLRDFYLRRLGAGSAIFIPLVVGGQWTGYISALYSQPTNFPQAEVRRLISVAGQASVAVQSIRQLQETQHRVQREQALREITTIINATQDLSTGLPEIAKRIHELVSLDIMMIALYTPGDQEATLLAVHAKTDLGQLGQFFRPGLRLPLRGSGSGWVITHNQARLDLDFSADPAFAQEFSEGAALCAAGLAAWIILPLRSAGQVSGTLALISAQPAAFTSALALDLQPVADQVALALERARLLEETRAALAEVDTTHRRYLREQWETYLSTSADRARGYIDGLEGLEPLADTRPITPPAEQAIATPIRLRGEPIGSLEFYNQDTTRGWGEDERALVEALADQAALALENARLFEDTQLRARREQLINEITARIRASTDMGTVLRTTTEELAKTLRAARASIRLEAAEPSQEKQDS